ncbi:molybdopterin-binding protein [Sulfurimonas sp.]|jgi:molybdopterin-binding protein|uniref:TOBE domain-containing protein n=1 Tax=Sulfurimonas sp. TaxID=2022749 RepID=UPI0025D5CAC0|nr:TOBE domain-containing protein [Sulfurimonas sp.]MBT5935601.1 transporter [Sulfurimonas sp.]
MSKFKASIIDIQSEQELHIVSFNAHGVILKMISLDLNDNIKVDTNVQLTCKATTVALAKEFKGSLSYSNQILMKIAIINHGELLSSLILQKEDFTLESIITTSSLERMNLQVNDEVTALIKSSDLSIIGIL